MDPPAKDRTCPPWANVAKETDATQGPGEWSRSRPRTTRAPRDWWGRPSAAQRLGSERSTSRCSPVRTRVQGRALWPMGQREAESTSCRSARVRDHPAACVRTSRRSGAKGTVMHCTSEQSRTSFTRISAPKPRASESSLATYGAAAEPPRIDLQDEVYHSVQLSGRSQAPSAAQAAPATRSPSRSAPDGETVTAPTEARKASVRSAA